MNKNKLSNPVRLIAFFLTAVLLICTFGFTVDGWQINNPPSVDNPSANVPEKPAEGDVGDEGKDENTETTLPEVPIIKYYNRISGVECTEELSKTAHLAFVMNPDLPSYGISDADLLAEIPTEDECTRYVAFIPDINNIWKIGSLTASRGYINNLVKYFGGICVSNGNDDSIKYTSCSLTGQNLDLSADKGYQYTEFTSNVYTNRDLLLSGLTNAGIDRLGIAPAVLPYAFTEEKGSLISNGKSAAVISIVQSQSSLTELIYNAESGKYSLYKNGTPKLDAINNKTSEFTNCFVLFADSITYDNSDYSQMIMDTVGEGKGYYFSEGVAIEINWVGTADGVLTFYSPDGEKLTANRGKTYISFVKSSKIEGVSFR